MHRWLQVMVLGFALMVAAPVRAFSEIAPEDYVHLTALSRRIVLVDVESVKISTIENKKGVEVIEVVIVGKRIETIRGDDKEVEFRIRSEEMRISDRAEAEQSLPEEVYLGLLRGRPHRASLCEKGHRYLVIFPDDGPTIFFGVRKDDDAWRKQIHKYVKP